MSADKHGLQVHTHLHQTELSVWKSNDIKNGLFPQNDLVNGTFILLPLKVF